MEENLLTRVYTLLNELIHTHELKSVPNRLKKCLPIKTCLVTGLDISMQTTKSKFLSAKGVEWYFDNQPEKFNNILSPYLSERWKNKTLPEQFIDIAHNIRNKDSNPRNNIRRKIKRILEDKNTLFEPLSLIDKSKLKEAGINS